MIKKWNHDVADNCVQPITAFGGGSVMVWAGIRFGGRTPLVPIAGNLNSPRYIAEILTPHVVPCAQQIGNQFIFQDDNARPHRARIVTEYLQQQAITRIEWPACSPDLNPIELLWDQLGRAVHGRIEAKTTLAQLRNFLVEEWNALAQDRVNRLINSMRRRCIACINADGGYTAY